MRYKSKTQALVMCAMMAALLAVLSPFTIPIGPVPFSLGVLAVALCGALLPPIPAVASLSVYILLGVFGLPVFTSFQGGPQVLLGPTGGYIVGYYLLALANSLAMTRLNRFVPRLLLALGGMAACYLLGTLWFMVAMGSGFWAALSVCVAPFAVWDVIKIAMALGLAAALERRRLPAGGRP